MAPVKADTGNYMIETKGHALLWVYRQLFAMPYIALARQAWIYRNISVTFGRLRS